MPTQNSWNNTVPSATTTFNNGLTIDTSGRATNAAQPAFLAFLSASVTNVTGNGDRYTIAANTEVFDQGGNYNNSTFTFTAPVTGRYYFFANAQVDNLSASFTTTQIVIEPSNFSPNVYNSSYNNGGALRAADNKLTMSINVIHQLTANDTVQFKLAAVGGTKIVGVTGGQQFTFVGGFLIS